MRRQIEEEEEEVQMKSEYSRVQRQVEEEEEEQLFQPKAEHASIQRQMGEEGKEEEETPIQTKTKDSWIQRQEEEEEEPGQAKSEIASVSRQIEDGKEEVDKSDAQKQLLLWNKLAIKSIDNSRAWLAANWTAYLGRTALNPRLSWTESIAGATVSNTVGNLLSELGEDLIKKAGSRSVTALSTAIGTAVNPGVGTVIGFIIGVLVEQVAGMVFDWITGKSDVDKAAAAAGRRAGDLIAAKTCQLDKQAAVAFDKHLKLFSSVQTKLTKSMDKEEVDRIRDWAVKEKRVMKPPNPNAPKTLFKQMLHDWVLEHAGDEEDANKVTSEAQWEHARTEIFGESDSLDNHPEVFAYQTRLHWAKAGLPTAPVQKMIERVKNLQKDSENPAKTVQGTFDGKTFTFGKPVNPDAFIKFIIDQCPFPIDKLSSKTEHNIRDGTVEIRCTLDLTIADGACYVDEWKYYTKLTGDIEWHVGRSVYFDVSPD